MIKRGVKLKVKEFINLLEKENQDFDIYFGGLDFYRLVERGDAIHVEFNQTISQDDFGNVIIQNHILPE